MTPHVQLDSGPGALGWWRQGLSSLLREMRSRWYFFALLIAIWVLAIVRVFVHHTPLLPVYFNVTPSLPYTLAYAEFGELKLQRGDFVVYEFRGQAAERDYPGLHRQPFFKRVAGIPGDHITVEGRDVFVNGRPVGRAKLHAFDRKPLVPISPTVIPPGFLYVQGTSPDSFDSRYTSSGLVQIADVTAKVHPIF